MVERSFVATLLRVFPWWCLEMKFQVIFNRLTMKNFTLQFVFSMLLNQIENLILAQISFRTLFLSFFSVVVIFFQLNLITLFPLFLIWKNLHKKMTQAQFIENLTGLCDGKDFPKDLLKVCTIY